MKIGTKSILFGVHCFFIHPIFVAWAWWRLYGFPKKIQLWFAFFLHDIGYIGKSNMDGEEGERHPVLGALIMQKLFGKKWSMFTLTHSRYFAKRYNLEPSKLCVADKLATAMTPAWLFIPLAWLSGELKEYRNEAKNGKYKEANVYDDSVLSWYRKVRTNLYDWVYKNYTIC